MSTDSLDLEFLKQVESALAEVASQDLGPITADRPITDLGLDSVSLAELMVVLEDRLNVSIDDKEMRELKTFGDLQQLMARLTPSAPPGPPTS